MGKVARAELASAPSLLWPPWSEEHVLHRTEASQKVKKLDTQIRNRFEDDWKPQWDDVEGNTASIPVLPMVMLHR